MPGDRINVWAAAPDGQPYLHAAERLDVAQGGDRAGRRPGACPAASLIRGKVTEEGTGQPVADAMVSFSRMPASGPRRGGGWALTKADGSFAFAVGPHPGHLSVQAPGEDYQLQVISNARFYGGNQGRGVRLYAHAFLPYDPRPGTETPEIRVALRRGATVKFRLIGPDGQPARDVSRLQPGRPRADGRVRDPDVAGHPGSRSHVAAISRSTGSTPRPRSPSTSSSRTASSARPSGSRARWPHRGR